MMNRRIYGYIVPLTFTHTPTHKHTLAQLVHTAGTELNQPEELDTFVLGKNRPAQGRGTGGDKHS